jgi:hypothetical protein
MSLNLNLNLIISKNWQALSVSDGYMYCYEYIPEIWAQKYCFLHTEGHKREKFIGAQVDDGLMM